MTLLFAHFSQLPVKLCLRLIAHRRTKQTVLAENELVAALLTESAQPLTQLEVMYGIADSRIDSVEIAAVVVAVLFVRGVDKDFSV